MKVLDLHCQLGHVFEGWFGSEDDFQSQIERGLIQCPLCGDGHIAKRLSAPRLNLGGRRQAEPEAAVQTSESVVDPSRVPSSAALQAAWLDLARKMVANTEDVGAGFAQEARRIHRGQAEERAIRGQATADETLRLLDEGIAVLPLPVSIKEPLQ